MSESNGHAPAWQVEGFAFTPRQQATNPVNARYARRSAYLELALVSDDDPAGVEAYVAAVRRAITEGTEGRLAAVRARHEADSPLCRHWLLLGSNLAKCNQAADQARTLAQDLERRIQRALVSGQDPSELEQQLRQAREEERTQQGRAAVLDSAVREAGEKAKAELERALAEEARAIAAEARHRREAVLERVREFWHEHLAELQTAGGMLDALEARK